MREGRVKKKIQSRKERIILLAALVLMVLVSVLYAYKIGLLFCGYYFADDHEIARLHGGIVRDGLWKTMKLWIEVDANLRFRPVYWVFRVLESYFCGTHVVLWHLIKACEIGFCAWLAVVFARKMKVGWIVSFLFGVIPFFGPQCAVVYRLGPQEPLALVWLFASLICAVCYAESGKASPLFLFHLFMTLMMMTKEAFLILVPVIVCFLLWQVLQNEYGTEEKPVRAIVKLLKNHIWSIVYEAVAFCLCMGIIVFHSGVSSIGYAGLDASYSVADYAAGMWKIWKGDLFPYLVVLLITICVNIVFCVRKRKEKGFVFLRCCELLFVLYFVFSQSLLHAKSGMSERYLFPCITGILIYVFCFGVSLWTRLWQQSDKETGKRRITGCKWKTIIAQTLLVIWSAGMIYTSQFHALCVNYVLTCSNNTQMLIRLSELAKERGGESCKIIVSTPYGEWNLAVCAFMEELYGVKHTFALSQSDQDNRTANDRYVIGEETEQTIDVTEADLYVAQLEFLPMKMRECGLEYTQMQQEIFGNYIIFMK